MMGTALSLIAVLSLLAAAVMEWLAHRRVRSVQAHEVTPEAIRYVSQRQEDQ